MSASWTISERRTGELLRETAKNGERATKGKPSKMSHRSTLPDHGISRDQSSDWQKLADIPAKRFEEELKKPGIPSTHQILANVNPRAKEKSPIENVDPDALWLLWGTLRDFKRVLGRDTNELERNSNTPVLSMQKPMNSSALES